jgi:hypothetical protein
MLLRSLARPHMRKAVLLFCLLWMISIPSQRAIATALPKPQADEYEWLEYRTVNFSIIYPSEYEQLAALVILLGPTLDLEYERLSSLFETTLLTPISVRIYPTIEEFKKLNPLALLPNEDVLHSHIGVREIVFIAQNMDFLGGDWQQDGLNALRHELAILFVQNLTDNKAPLGLQMGIGSYAEDPGYLFGRYGSDPMSLASLPYWRSLWEDPGMLSNPRLNLDVASLVAFLVDTYGWPSFLEFLNKLATVESTRRAILEVYDIDQAEMGELWKAYFPLYMESRGASHILYGYDLAPFNRLIRTGAYSEAASRLPEAIAFLEKINSKERLAQAQALLEQARLGQEGNRIALEARSALQAGEYELSTFYSDQAQAIFEPLSDSRHQEELDSYRAFAQEILDLNKRLEDIEVKASLEQDPGGYVTELLSISQRMSEVGDGPGLERANHLVESIQNRQNETIRTKRLAVSGIALLLLAVRLWMLRWKKPAEAQLI